MTSSNQVPSQFTWQTILWRLLLTGLILLLLIGASLNFFQPVTSQPEPQTLPVFGQQLGR